MKKFDTSITIQRPIAEVFAAVIDFKRYPTWRSGLIEATLTSEGPIQVGTTYRYNIKVMGSVLETTGRIEAYEPPGYYAWKATSGPFPMSGSLKCGAVAEGTRLTDTLEADPGGFFKLAEPLLMKGQQDQMERDLKQLKDLLEGDNS
jgi:uncharacterized protein YndB with AHSA1/START domain